MLDCSSCVREEKGFMKGVPFSWIHGRRQEAHFLRFTRARAFTLLALGDVTMREVEERVAVFVCGGKKQMKIDLTLVMHTESLAKHAPDERVQARVARRVPNHPHGEELAVFSNRHQPARPFIAEVEAEEGQRLADAVRPRLEPHAGAGACPICEIETEEGWPRHACGGRPVDRPCRPNARGAYVPTSSASISTSSATETPGRWVLSCRMHAAVDTCMEREGVGVLGFHGQKVWCDCRRCTVPRQRAQ